MKKIVQVCYISYIEIEDCDSDIEAIVKAKKEIHENLSDRVIEFDAFDYTVTDTIENN